MFSALAVGEGLAASDFAGRSEAKDLRRFWRLPWREFRKQCLNLPKLSNILRHVVGQKFLLPSKPNNRILECKADRLQSSQFLTTRQEALGHIVLRRDRLGLRQQPIQVAAV